MTKTRVKFDVDSMFVGRCSATDEDLKKCTGGGNKWGDLAAREGSCKKDNEIGFTVKCKDPGLCDRESITRCFGWRFCIDFLDLYHR